MFAAVVVLRVREPALPRVVRMGGSVRFGSSDVPVLALVGLAMSWALWVLVLGTHRAGRILPPIWLGLGLLVFVGMRRLQGQPLLKRIETVAPPPLEVIDMQFGTILVPLKARGPIEEEMLAIACKLAQEQGARVLGVNVVEVPLALRAGRRHPGHGREGGRAARADRVVRPGLRRARRLHGAAQPRDQRRDRARRARGGRRA